MIPTPPPPPRPTIEAQGSSPNVQEDELDKFPKLHMIKAIYEICIPEPFPAYVSLSSECFVMKLDCVRIQSHQHDHGTSVPEYLLLIRNDF